MLKAWLLSVVTLYFFVRSTRMPFSRINRPTRPLSAICLIACRAMDARRQSQAPSTLQSSLGDRNCQGSNAIVPSLSSKLRFDCRAVDVRQNNHVGSLPLTGRATAKGTQAA